MNEMILHWMEAVRGPWLDRLAEGLALLGGTWGVAVQVVVFGVFWRNRRFIAVAVSVGVAYIVTAILKDAVNGPRPGDAFPDLALAAVKSGGGSFPSGHAALTAALAAGVAFCVFLYRRIPSEHGRGWFLVAILAVIEAAAVGVARCYQGASFPTDVLGGWLIGTIIGMATTIAIVRQRRPSVESQES
jgi:membrane-associated phospholipid phosphatase